MPLLQGSRYFDDRRTSSAIMLIPCDCKFVLCFFCTIFRPLIIRCHFLISLFSICVLCLSCVRSWFASHVWDGHSVLLLVTGDSCYLPHLLVVPSVLWHGWASGRGWWRWVQVSPWMEWRPAGWSVFLPLLIFTCTMKSRSSLLAPAHLDGPGKRVVKWLWYHIFWFCCFTVLTSLLQSQIYSRFLISAFLGNKKVPVRMSHTSNTAACLKLSFTAGAA